MIPLKALMLFWQDKNLMKSDQGFTMKNLYWPQT